VSNRLGEKINRNIVELVRSKTVKPIVGRVVDFEAIPAAMEALANRQTVGRTIAKLY
jgi:NADPH:quinone reductase-like Zn-dependent oxidoreductase